jgi:hypothetical protein
MEANRTKMVVIRKNAVILASKLTQNGTKWNLDGSNLLKCPCFYPKNGTKMEANGTYLVGFARNF